MTAVKCFRPRSSSRCTTPRPVSSGSSRATLEMASASSLSLKPPSLDASVKTVLPLFVFVASTSARPPRMSALASRMLRPFTAYLQGASCASSWRNSPSCCAPPPVRLRSPSDSCPHLRMGRSPAWTAAAEGAGAAAAAVLPGMGVRVRVAPGPHGPANPISQAERTPTSAATHATAKEERPRDRWRRPPPGGGMNTCGLAQAMQQSPPKWCQAEPA
mmetsp:Transcript_66928/g.207285  ORF Transcript_66928/g.207285 Transcript_66928/m.207285 type:complete len:217 (+) Transcript_66928:154-804(+)